MEKKPKFMMGIAALSMLGLLAGCGNTGNASTSNTGNSLAGNSESNTKVTLTYWSWGESDIPGYDKWLAAEVAKYEKAHPNITINVVAQNTDTLTGAFQSAAQTHSGPDIATLWATIPVLTQAWGDYIVPISDYVSKSELKHWLNTSENTYSGKVWGMPVYLIGVPLVYNKDLFAKAGLNPNSPPTTWSELLADAAQLKAHGITPFGMGNKDGYTGAWMFSLFGKQNLNSVKDLQNAIIGKTPVTDPPITGWYASLADLINKGYFNNDVSSLDLNNGWKVFPSGKAAMSWTTDGNAISWLKQLGGDSHVGVMKTPPFGTGKLATAYDATQSSTVFITSWSKHKQQAADFLTFLHSKQSIDNFYTRTGGFPADDRFNTSLITDPVATQLWKWDTTGTQVWLENYLPPMVDQNADIAGGQTITSKSGTAAQVAQLWKTVVGQWSTQHPDELKSYKNWTQH